MIAHYYDVDPTKAKKRQLQKFPNPKFLLCFLFIVFVKFDTKLSRLIGSIDKISFDLINFLVRLIVFFFISHSNHFLKFTSKKASFPL